MDRKLVGEPGVSAFLRSVLGNLGGISRMKPNYTAPFYYDPRGDLEKLREKLIFFQGLVVDGEAKRLDDPSVDEWMDEINDLLYDVEDIFEDIKSLRKDQVSFNCPLLKKFSDDINSRFEKIYARAQKLGEKAETLKLERVSWHAFLGESKVTVRTRETSSVVDISEVHGREDDKNDIVKRLLKVDGRKGKKNYDVICIVGMGGLGKTTLAQLVFNAPKVVKHFDVKSWVCISNVFDVARATKELIEYSNGGGSLGDQSLAVLQRRLKEMVANKRFLFVLDDLWSSSEWGEMKASFSSCANGSKILVTTRKIQIAHALGNKYPYQLQELNHEECMEIFRNEAFGDDEGEEEKVNLVEKIVRACRGVPLVIKVIGSMLQVAADVEKWRVVSENIGSWANENDEIHPAIRFSYYDLPAYLKRCFEYLAVFPPDYQLKQDDVVRLWIADGLVDEKEGRMAEDIGAEYYNELKARSLIQENDMMHDIVHHLATVVSRKFCYKENSKEPPASVRHAFLVNLNATHCEFLAEAPGIRTLIVKGVEDENVLRNTIRSCKMIRALLIDSCLETKTLSIGESFIDDHLTHIRYLTIHGSDIRHLPDSPCMLDNLQFLDLSSNMYLENFVDRVNHLSNLRCLMLLDVFISSLPESICSLSQLQVLILIGCRNLIQLPKDIGNLKSLRTLDVRFTSILSVPESILNITGLQYLLVDQHKQLPLYIGRLARLKELPFYYVGKEEGRGLDELNLMNKLQCWLRIGSMENIGGVEEAKMADLKRKNVWGLQFQWSEPGNDEEKEVKIMEALEPHHALRNLRISNYGGSKFPAWIMPNKFCFSNLTTLCMEGLNKIYEMIDMEFVSLEYLKIENCLKLRKISMVTPNLMELHMKNCLELEADFVHLLPSLTENTGLHSILSQLTDLECACNVFEYFCEKLRTANSKWDKLRYIILSEGGTRVSSLLWGWPSIMTSLETMNIWKIEPGQFQFLPDGDQSAFPPNLNNLLINSYMIKERLPHFSYTITSDGKVESYRKKVFDTEEVKHSDE